MAAVPGLKAILCGIACLAVTGEMASAQVAAGRYSGVGLSFSHAKSDPGTGAANSTGDLSALSLTLGNKWDMGDYSYALELGADVNLGGSLSQSDTCGVSATGPYMCDPDATVRLRGMFGTQLGDVELFGAVGVGATFGTFATSTTTTGSGSVYGLTLGTGVSYPLREGLSLRGEVNYDAFTKSNQPNDQNSDWNALSARVTAVFNF